MNNKAIYKYFNLIIRIIIGAFAILYIVWKLKSFFVDNDFAIDLNNINLLYILFTLFLMFINWGIESYKWMCLVNLKNSISFISSFSSILSGITVSLITPNRIGEIPGRVYLLKDSNKKELILLTSIGAFAQLIITLILGLFSIFFVFSFYISNLSSYYYIFFVAISMGLIFFYFKFNRFSYILKKIPFFKKHEIFNVDIPLPTLIVVLVLSGIRFFVFTLQYWLVLKAFNINLFSLNEILLIPFCFLLASSIPTLLLSEIGVRTSVAIFVFSVVSNDIISITFSSIIIWVINIALPATLGIFNLKKLNFFNQTS